MSVVWSRKSFVLKAGVDARRLFFFSGGVARGVSYRCRIVVSCADY